MSCKLKFSLLQIFQEAMHRRITLTVEFRDPDASMRREIWKNHLPENVKTNDINWNYLSTKYELTGGFIKNGTKILQTPFH